MKKIMTTTALAALLTTSMTTVSYASPINTISDMMNLYNTNFDKKADATKLTLQGNSFELTSLTRIDDVEEKMMFEGTAFANGEISLTLVDEHYNPIDALITKTEVKENEKFTVYSLIPRDMKDKNLTVFATLTLENGVQDSVMVPLNK